MPHYGDAEYGLYAAPNDKDYLFSDHKHEVLRRGANRPVEGLLFGNAGEEAARPAERTTLGWWSLAKITRLELAGGAICIEIQDPFAWQ
jgi:hypothetical protein